MMMVRVDFENTIEDISKQNIRDGNLPHLEQPLSSQIMVQETRQLEAARSFSLKNDQPQDHRVQAQGGPHSYFVSLSNSLPQKYLSTREREGFNSIPPIVTSTVNPLPQKYRIVQN